MFKSPAHFRNSISGLWSHTDLTPSPKSWITLGRWLNLCKCQLPCVQRLNIEGLTTAFGKPCLQSWPLGGIWDLRFQAGSHHGVKSSSLYLSCLYKQTSPAFLLRVWNLGMCLRDKPPVKILGTCHNSLLGERVLCHYPGTGLLKLIPSLPQTLSHVPLPFADFAL